MQVRTILVAAVIGMLLAWGVTGGMATEAEAQPPNEQSSSTTDKPGATKLKTGEWLDDLSYGKTYPLGGESEALLTVEFRSPAEPGLREASLQELVTQTLLTRAMREGYRKARLWVRSSKTSVGPLRFTSNEDWAFERGDGTQWRQTDGPEIDWSIIIQNLAPNPELSLNVAQKVLQTKWDSGLYVLELRTVAFPELSPNEAMRSTVRLLADFTQCDKGTDLQPAFLSDDNLRAVWVYAYPVQKRDLLDIVPFVHYELARTDGRWTCDRQSMLDEVEKLDWQTFKTWDDIIR